jgi:hypothetical protein
MENQLMAHGKPELHPVEALGQNPDVVTGITPVPAKPEGMSMVEKPKLELFDSAPGSVFDDIDALRKTATLKVRTRIVPFNVPVGKPQPYVYFRSHSDPSMALDASVLIGSEWSDDFYFPVPRMLDHPAVLPRLRKVTIAVVYTWPGGAISVWPVPFAEDTRIACRKSARAAYELSKAQWVQMIWNADKRDYDVAIAEGINTEPLWPPDLNLSNLLKLGFADRIIDTPEHPYVRQLRGLADQLRSVSRDLACRFRVSTGRQPFAGAGCDVCQRTSHRLRDWSAPARSIAELETRTIRTPDPACW